MALKLSEQLDADALAAFALYAKYLQTFRYKFPASVLALMENPDWSGGCMSNSPHDSWLTGMELSGVGTEECCLELHLSKPHLNLEIRIRYVGVMEMNMPIFKNIPQGNEWRYEQFRYFDPYHSHGIKNLKMFTHDIEWVDGDVWSITAREIAVEWVKEPPNTER